MRRKLFLIAAVLLIAVFFISELKPDIWVPREAVPDEKASTHRGIVLNVSEKNGRLDLDIKDERGFPVRLSYYGESREDLWNLPGSLIEYEAELQEPRTAGNPNCFDYRKYLRSTGIYLSATVKTWQVKGREEGVLWKYKRGLFHLKYLFRGILPERSGGLIMGMIFGDTNELDEDIYEDFKRNGTAHVLAVSGLHVGILFSIYERISRGRTSPGSLAVLAFLLYTYGVLACWKPSIVRAEIMIVMKTIARAKELRYDSLTSLSFAALILILRNPYVIYGTGFQMSFLAIMAMDIVLRMIPEKIPDGLARAISINVTMLLYQAYVFNAITPLAVLVNIPVIYLAGIAIPLSLGTFAVFGIGTAAATDAGIFGAGSPLLIPAVSMSDLLIKLNSLMDIDGISSIDVISPPKSLVIFGVIGMLFACSEPLEIMKLRGMKKSIIKIFGALAALALAANMICYEPLSRDQIVFVDVGQGACTHINAGSVDIMIDGGGSRNYDIGKNTLKPYLLKNGARDLDLALATHEDTDHIKGLEELCGCMGVKAFKAGSVRGDRVGIADGIYIETLWPMEVTRADGEIGNDESSVFMIHYLGIRILVTGDLSEEGERAMISYYNGQGNVRALKADVLNVGHHGSKYSSCDEFLDAVSPDIAVIQVGKNNYGHPSQETLERLEEHHIKVFRNDICGAVGLRIGKNGLSAVHVMKEQGAA